MNERMRVFYMRVAAECAAMSYAKRLQVGAVVVKDDNILSFSWNGTPKGWDNSCEHTEILPASAFDKPGEAAQNGYTWCDSEQHWHKLVTNPEVLHAERNALDKLAATKGGGRGASLFVTHSPCIECAKSIYQAGIVEVYYLHSYRCDAGLDFLKRAGVAVHKLEIVDI
jgi:dCMP deaminase